MLTDKRIKNLGRYARPIFWAGLMCYWSSLLYGFIISGRGITWPDSSLSTIILNAFMLLAVVLVILISIYRVTHPYESMLAYITKKVTRRIDLFETPQSVDKSDVDERWGAGTIIVAILTPIVFILHFVGYI